MIIGTDVVMDCFRCAGIIYLTLDAQFVWSVL